MTRIESAILFAAKAHSGKCRKTNDKPIILHSIEVMTIVARHTCDEDVIIAALLHDLKDRTSVKMQRIEEQFGPRVARLIELSSEDKMKKLPADATWRARKWKKIFNLKKADEGTQLICLADVLSDLRELKRAYDKIGDDVWERFNQKDKEMHAWYYREILHILEKTFEYEYYWETEEYSELIDWVFGYEKRYNW